MERLIIQPTKTSPYICCDTEENIFVVEGQSFPEDPREVFAPLINWLEVNLKSIQTPISFHLKTEYFNSSSNRILLKILRILEMYTQTGKNIEISWHYTDEDGQNDGLIFKRLLNMPFNLIYSPGH